MVSKVLILTGMHRSGTSLTAQYLDKCGLALGEQMLHLDKDRPTGSFLGHHEDTDFLNFHMDTLRKRRKDPSGYLIANTRSLRQSASKLPIKVNKLEKAKALSLANSRQHLSQWGWKDPRTVLFLKLWRQTIPDAKFLFLFRNPLAVAESLLRKSKNSIVFQDSSNPVRIWILYNREIIKFLETNRCSSMLWEIDSLVQDSEPFQSAMRKRFGIELEPVSITNVLSERAFHFNASDRMESIKLKHPSIISEALSIYEQLKKQVG